MEGPSNGSPRGTSLPDMVAAFLTFSIGAILWRLLTHLTGWQQHEVWESLAFALFMGCGAVAINLLLDRLRRP